MFCGLWSVFCVLFCAVCDDSPPPALRPPSEGANPESAPSAPGPTPSPPPPPPPPPEVQATVHEVGGEAAAQPWATPTSLRGHLKSQQHHPAHYGAHGPHSKKKQHPHHHDHHHRSRSPNTAREAQQPADDPDPNPGPDPATAPAAAAEPLTAEPHAAEPCAAEPPATKPEAGLPLPPMTQSVDAAWQPPRVDSTMAGSGVPSNAPTVDTLGADEAPIRAPKNEPKAAADAADSEMDARDASFLAMMGMSAPAAAVAMAPAAAVAMAAASTAPATAVSAATTAAASTPAVTAADVAAFERERAGRVAAEAALGDCKREIEMLRTDRAAVLAASQERAALLQQTSEAQRVSRTDQHHAELAALQRQFETTLDTEQRQCKGKIEAQQAAMAEARALAVAAEQHAIRHKGDAVRHRAELEQAQADLSSSDLDSQMREQQQQAQLLAQRELAEAEAAVLAEQLAQATADAAAERDGRAAALQDAERRRAEVEGLRSQLEAMLAQAQSADSAAKMQEQQLQYQLESAVTPLQQQIAALTAEVSAAQAAVQQRDVAGAELASGKSSAEQAAAEAAGELQRAQAELSAARADWSEQEHQRRLATEAAVAPLRQRVEQLEADLAAATAGAVAAQSSGAALQAQATTDAVGRADCDAELARSKALVAELSAGLEDAQMNEAGARREVLDAQGVTDVLRIETLSLQAALNDGLAGSATATAEVLRLHATVDKLEDRNRRLQADSEAAAAQFQAWEQRMQTTVDGTSSDHQKDTALLRAELSAKVGEVGRLSAAAREAKAARQHDLQQLAGRLEQLELDNAAAGAEAAGHEKQLLARDATISRLEGQLTELQAVLGATKKESEAARAVSAQNKIGKSSAERASQQLQLQIEQLQQEAGGTAAAAQQREAKLQSTSKGVIDTLKRQLSQRQSDVATAEASAEQAAAALEQEQAARVASDGERQAAFDQLLQLEAVTAAAAQQQQHNQQQRQSDLHAEKAQLAAQRDQAAAKAAVLVEQLAQASAEASAERDGRAAALQDAERRRAEVEGLRSQLEAVLAQAQSADSATKMQEQQLQYQLESAVTPLQQQIAALTAEVSAAQAAVQQRDVAGAELASGKSSAEQAAAEAAGELQRAQAELSAARADWSEQEHQLRQTGEAAAAAFKLQLAQARAESAAVRQELELQTATLATATADGQAQLEAAQLQLAEAAAQSATREAELQLSCEVMISPLAQQLVEQQGMVDAARTELELQNATAAEERTAKLAAEETVAQLNQQLVTLQAGAAAADLQRKGRDQQRHHAAVAGSAQLKQQIAAVQAELAAANAEAAKHRTVADAETAGRAAAERQAEHQHDEIVGLRSQLDQALDQAQSADSESRLREQQLQHQLESTVAPLGQHVAQLRSELVAAKADADAAAEAAAAWEAQIASWESAAAERDAQLVQLKSDLRAAFADGKRLQEAMGSDRSAKAAALSAASKFEGECAALRDQVVELSVKIVALEEGSSRARDAEDALEEKEDRSEHLRARVAELQAALETSNAETERCLKAAEDEKSKRLAAKGAKVQADRKLKRLQAEVDGLMAAAAAAAATAAAAPAPEPGPGAVDLAAATAPSQSVSSLQAALEAEQAAVLATKQEIETQRLRSQQLAAQVEAADARSTLREQQLQQMQSNLQTTVKPLQDQVARLEPQIGRAKEETERYRTALANEQAEARAQHASAGEEIVRLKHELAAAAAAAAAAIAPAPVPAAMVPSGPSPHERTLQAELAAHKAALQGRDAAVLELETRCAALVVDLNQSKAAASAAAGSFDGLMRKIGADEAESGRRQQASDGLVELMGTLEKLQHDHAILLKSSGQRAAALRIQSTEISQLRHQLQHERSDRPGPNVETAPDAAAPARHTEVDQSLLLLCRQQEAKIIELMQRRTEQDELSSQREKRIIDLERRVSQMAAISVAPASHQSGSDGSVRLQESEEKVAFIFKKFIFVSQRCKLLEETCRALLDASASANEQAMLSVTTVAGGDSTGNASGVSSGGLGGSPYGPGGGAFVSSSHSPQRPRATAEMMSFDRSAASAYGPSRHRAGIGRIGGGGSGGAGAGGGPSTSPHQPMLHRSPGVGGVGGGGGVSGGEEGVLASPQRPRPQLPPAASFLELLRRQRRQRAAEVAPL